MKRLVNVNDLGEGQYEELVAALRRAGIGFRETPGVLFLSGRILVAPDEYPRAKAVLDAGSESYAARARERWREEWRTVHRESHLRWFLNRLRDDPVATLARVMLLAAALALFVGLPLWYITRA